MKEQRQSIGRYASPPIHGFAIDGDRKRLRCFPRLAVGSPPAEEQILVADGSIRIRGKVQRLAIGTQRRIRDGHFWIIANNNLLGLRPFVFVRIEFVGYRIRWEIFIFARCDLWVVAVGQFFIRFKELCDAEPNAQQ